MIIFSLRLPQIKTQRSIAEPDLWITKPADKNALDELVKQSLKKEGLELVAEATYKIINNVVHAEGIACKANDSAPVIAYLM